MPSIEGTLIHSYHILYGLLRTPAGRVLIGLADLLFLAWVVKQLFSQARSKKVANKT